MFDNNAVTVLNLSTGDYQIYTCDSRTAVLSAYAQSLGNWNTWEYERLYGHLLLEGEHSWNCGDFSALKTKGENDGQHS